MGVAVLRGAEAVGGVVKRLFEVLGGVGRLKVWVGCIHFMLSIEIKLKRARGHVKEGLVN